MSTDQPTATNSDSTLGVGHVWTRQACPAYGSLDPADCACQADRTVWQLARLADCADPDAWNSAGAKFLVRVETAMEDARDGCVGPDDMAEIADGCVPIYTHEVWATFSDLAAYQEDISDLIGADADMEKMAQVALYMIAERLLSALLADAA